jgi:protein associated with RNAse G/E
VDAVDLVLRKYDGRPHRRVTGRLLGEDEFGTWIGTPRGTLVRYSYGLRRFSWTRADAVRLIPRDRWWIAMFSAEPSRSEIYCDVTTPARRTGPGEFTVIDLDLDLIRLRAGGRVVIDDEDEFAEHRTRFGYPDDVVAAATAATAELHTALTGGAEPFAGHYHRWLTRAAEPGRRERRSR